MCHVWPKNRSYILGLPSAFAKERRMNFQTRECKVTLLNPWPRLLRCWTFCSRVHIFVCKFRHPYAGVPCSMAWCMTCLGIDSIGQFVLNKYHQIFFFFLTVLCYFWTVEAGWGKSPTKQKEHGKMVLQCVALIHLNDLMTSRGLQENTMHAGGSKGHPLPVLWNSKWIPGREHNARLL